MGRKLRGTTQIHHAALQKARAALNDDNGIRPPQPTEKIQPQSSEVKFPHRTAGGLSADGPPSLALLFAPCVLCFVTADNIIAQNSAVYKLFLRRKRGKKKPNDR